MTTATQVLVTTDLTHLRRAVRAARAGPAADPNPRVGAVVVDRHGQVAGTGHHRGAGSPHAETQALRSAGSRASGATVYVTLEPCDHEGRTGPCSVALARAGVARVVYAVPDPDPRAQGGARRLRDLGVCTEHLPYAAADELVRHWLSATVRGRPWVTWKFAATLDGRVAAVDGSSAWVTSPQARGDGHRLRAEHGAVLVGTGTALADDPTLTARPRGAPVARQPLRVVLGRRDLPAEARVRDGQAALAQLRHHDVGQALRELHGRQVRGVLVEGGPTVAAAFWRAGVVDEVVAYLAPALLGAGPAAVGDLGIRGIEDIARLGVHDVRQVGPDIRVVARPLVGQEEG